MKNWSQFNEAKKASKFDKDEFPQFASDEVIKAYFADLLDLGFSIGNTHHSDHIFYGRSGQYPREYTLYFKKMMTGQYGRDFDYRYESIDSYIRELEIIKHCVNGYINDLPKETKFEGIYIKSDGIPVAQDIKLICLKFKVSS